MSTPGREALSPDLLEACSARRARLVEDLGEAGVDGLLIAHPKDILYLTGFVGDDSWLLIRPGAATVVTDARHDEMLQPWRDAAAIDVVLGTRHQLEASLDPLCGQLKRVGVQAEHLTIAARRRLVEGLSGRTLVDTEGLVAGLRMIKDDLEIAAIERAISIHQDAMRAALDQLSVGMTELELCAIIEYEMKVRGASGPSFSTCVSAGAHSSIIHYLTAAVPIETGVLLLDWGAVVDGYCSDMTRTFGVEHMPPKMGEIYDIVLEAQLAAIDACGPGRTCAEVDAVARRIITEAGYGSNFGHGLGHGFGLNIHEPPFFNQQATGTVLAPGMVMTVEPGIYLPGIGGVRIEDDVLITDGGCRVLTDFPKGPQDAVLEPARIGGSV